MQPLEARGKHITSHSVVDVDGDYAAATTDYLFVRPTPDGPAVIAAGRYYDQLARHGHRWQFRERAITILGVPGGGSGG
jgi:hypothetical protein